VVRGHGHAALVDASGGHEFVRWEVPPRLSDTWWRSGDAVLFRRLRRHGVAFAALGGAAGVGALLDRLPQLAEEVHASWPLGLSVPRHLEPLVHERLEVDPGGDWDWFVTRTAPPAFGPEGLVRPLDDTARHEEVAAFLAEHSPTADTAPGEGETWWGIDLDGRLVATAAVGLLPSGAPSVSSVAVDASVRGRGLGRALVGAVTRRAVADHGLCTLGMYAHNTVARSLYASLGYWSPVAWASRSVRQRSEALCRSSP
jgi:GNAT superfamily N-acetyltransferase